VPPPHRSKHLLHEQPSFLSALLSNNSKKWPRRLGERKVSIWFVIYVLVCKSIINCISLTPPGYYFTQARGPISPPTHRIRRVCFIRDLGSEGR
jgi:hypothetical protein